MTEKNSTTNKKSVSADWLVQGVLTKIGETFDRLTGRNWKPSSSLATSELIDRLKLLLDSEAKDLGEKGKFVPHNIKLKMQWDKFSTDAEKALETLKYELLTAAIDHINDKRYNTYAPMSMEIKPDYFTEGVKLLASFDKFGDDEREAAVNVSVPDLKNVVINQIEPEIVEPPKEIYIVRYEVQGKAKQAELSFTEKQRRSVGRTKENDLQIDDTSVSKVHAALVLNSEKQLMVADTGSTNGTFVNDRRISYGKAILINTGDKLKFGNIEIALEHVSPTVENIEEEPTVVKTQNEPETQIMPEIKPVRAEPSAPLIIPKPAREKEPAPTVAMQNAGEKKTETDSTTEPRVILDFGENK